MVGIVTGFEFSTDVGMFWMVSCSVVEGIVVGFVFAGVDMTDVGAGGLPGLLELVVVALGIATADDTEVVGEVPTVCV